MTLTLLSTPFCPCVASSHAWTYAKISNVSSSHSTPFNSLCLSLCSMLQHMASLRWLSSCCLQPWSTSLGVRTCHLSKSRTLLGNLRISFRTAADKTDHLCIDIKCWKTQGTMYRRMAAGSTKAAWTNVKLEEQLFLNSECYHWEKSDLCLWWTCVVCEVNEKSVCWVKSAWRANGGSPQRLWGWRLVGDKNCFSWSSCFCSASQCIQISKLYNQGRVNSVQNKPIELYSGFY